MQQAKTNTLTAQYSWNGRPDMPHILQGFQGYLQLPYQLNKHPLTEDALSIYFKTHMLPIVGGNGYCEEVEGNPGNLEGFWRDFHALVRLRIWDGGFSSMGWIQQLELAMEEDRIEDGYLVLFHYGNPGPLHQGWPSPRETGQRIYEIGLAYGEGVRA